MKPYIILLILILLEIAILYIVNANYPLYAVSLTTIIVALNGIMSFILFNSILMSFICLPMFFVLYSIIFNQNFYQSTLTFVYYAPYYIIVTIFVYFIYSFIKRNFYDYLIDELRKTKINFSLTKLGIGVLISIILYWFLYRNFLFLAGSLLASIVVALYGFYYEIPLVALNWITLPYLVIPKQKLQENNLIIGKIVGKLGRGGIINSSFYTSDPVYKWLKYDSAYSINFIESKNYNVAIIGTSGVGKSTLAKKIAKNLEVSYLIFDLHGEYNINGAEKIDASSISINPLSLFGRSPKERALEVAMMLKSLFNLGNLQTIELVNLILEAYMEKGIDEIDKSTWDRPLPTIGDLLLLLEKKKKMAITSQDLIRYQSIEPYLQFLSSAIFSNSTIDMSNFLAKNIIIDFSKVPTNEIKYIIMETLLKSIQSYMYSSGISNLKKIIIIDEAPFILSKESGKQLLERLLAEGRKFGFGFIIISQSMEYVKEILTNVSHYFIFNLIEPKDLDYASKLIGGSDPHFYSVIYETLQKLPKGFCVTRDLLRGEVYLLKVDIGDL